MNFTITNKAYAKSIFSTLYKMVVDNKIYRLSFEEAASIKTKEQLGFIFGGIFKALRLFFQNYGYNFTHEQIKEWIYDEVGTKEIITLPNGRQKELNKTLSKMSKREASEFIFRVLEFIDTSEALQDFILPPDLRYCWVNHIDEKMIEDVLQEKWNYKNEHYLRQQRKLTCIRCGRRGAEAHHIKRGSGLGRKNPDWFTIPLCRECHTYLHSNVGEDNFLNEIKNVTGCLDIEIFCRLAYKFWLTNSF